LKLDIPILSIDYSLAPEYPFPRAFEEIFYVYCWILKNSELVGSTCKNIIFVGDSAGGNLNTACVVKIIEMGIQKPFGLFNMYAPFLLSFTTTPARYLSFVDPLLPYGFAMRVFKYYGSNEAIEMRKNNIADKENTSSWKFESLLKSTMTAIQDGDFSFGSTFIPKASDDEFTFTVPENRYLSPYLADEKILCEFPTTKILSMISDPCLDDCIEFSKKLRSLKVDITLDILNGVNHGFLNFAHINSECHLASSICLKRIEDILSCT
jgi:hormone-sensitive lipase